VAPIVKTIASRGNPLLVRLRRLATDPSAYRKFGQVWIEGEHLCSAFAQGAGMAQQAVISEQAWQVGSLRVLASTAARVAVVSGSLMADISALDSPAALGFSISWPGEGTLDPLRPSVVLDRLQDAGNVGNILRSAAAFGFTQVVAIKGTAALWSPKVLRAGMGAHFALTLVEGADETSLAAMSIPLLAASSHAGLAVHQTVLPWPCAWVMGHEGQGVSQSLMERCAGRLRIEQPGGQESLNVASAAAVCLYESARQRVA
jgi:RNA methyltransferase, TrmH family